METGFAALHVRLQLFMDVSAAWQCNASLHVSRQVLVFNCDGEFDFKSVGRIFIGLVKCGAWGCFDEFNRLEEDVLSAVSQQIQLIQVWQACQTLSTNADIPVQFTFESYYLYTCRHAHRQSEQ